MKIGIIICEYNPFHNGHLYHLQQSKKIMQCDKLICLMSGNIMQRGDISIADKYKRATWAIKCGADMVIEIPPEYCLGSAQIYAQGAIGLGNCLKGDKSLCFGSECGDIGTLQTIADLLQSQSLNDFIKPYLSQGKRYIISLSSALQDYCKSKNLANFNEVLALPNNTLGLEYLQAIKRINCDINAFTMTRIGDYNDLGTAVKYPSASAIRASLKEKRDISQYVPICVSGDLTYRDSDSKLFAIAKYHLFGKNLTNIFGIKEGLENRLQSSLYKCDNLSDFYKKISTKRYSMATLKRCLLSSIVDFEGSPCIQKNKLPSYANVLAIKKESLHLLSHIDLPCITKPSDYKRLNIKHEVMTKCDALFEAVCYSFDAYMRII